MLRRQKLRRFLVYVCIAAKRKSKTKEKKAKIKKQIKKVKHVSRSKTGNRKLAKEIKQLELMLQEVLDKENILEQKADSAKIKDDVLNDKLKNVQSKLNKYIKSTEQAAKKVDKKTKQLKKLESQIKKKKSSKEKDDLDEQVKRLVQLESIYSRMVNDKSVEPFRLFMVGQKIEELKEKIELLQRIV